MMKTNSKIFSILAILLISGLLVPTISFAKEGKWWNFFQRGNKPEGQEQQQGASGKAKTLICNRLVDWISKTDQRINQFQDRIQDRQIERIQKLEERRENRDTKLEQHRERWQEKWEEHFGELEDKATTSVQMEALLDFKEAVMEAIASRQAAVDEAISDFREALEEVINNRKTATEQARKEYMSAYQTAVQLAQQECNNGDDPAQVRERLRAALQAAREQYNKDIKEIEKLDLKPLVDARQQAFKEALEYFRKAMQEAKDKLKAALGL